MSKEILKEANQIKEQLIKWRRDIHKLAEIGLDMPNTSAYIQNELKKMNISFLPVVNGNGVLATIGTGNPCILLRSDMDALPIVEMAEVDFKATNNHMHACGHDLHATNLLGAAYLLKQHENELKGTVKLLFQPGEETLTGSHLCVKDGVLENPKVDHAFALHVNSMMPTNSFSYGKVPLSNVYFFKITIKGIGGHGSTPEMCKDPIYTLVQIYQSLSGLISKECPAEENITLTIGEFNAGKTGNVIPDVAYMAGSLRGFNSELVDRMMNRIKEISELTSKLYSCEYDVEILTHCPAVVCHDDMNNLVLKTLEEFDLPIIKSEETLQNTIMSAFQDHEHFYISDKFKAMASDDFGFISKEVPSGYYLLGSAINDHTKLYNQHDPRVMFSEDSLPLGCAIYTSVALNYFIR